MSPKLGGICSRRLACSGDPQLGWSYGGGYPRLNRPHGYLDQRVGAFLVLHCAENVWCEAGTIGRTNHWVANKISGLVVFRRTSVLLPPWCGGAVPPGGANTPAGVARRRFPKARGDVWGLPPPPEACNLLSSVRHNKRDRHKDISFSSSAWTESQQGLVAGPRCSQRGRNKRWG